MRSRAACGNRPLGVVEAGERLRTGNPVDGESFDLLKGHDGRGRAAAVASVDGPDAVAKLCEATL